MKHTFILFALALGLNSSGQDTIFLRSGDLIPAIVKSVSSKEVEYKKANNPDGPSYVTAINDVEAIGYRNGTKDKFAVTAPKPTEDYYGSQNSGATPPLAGS